ncbi:hypothetical protein CYMTET_23941 [Cymbomonas tetramitiformis]|uniref:Uncharacterized protein n=1 Tax=Cymbomonas tetramitiformis TaxID=36881 RepID=A0AAE0FWS7_9CHLO|nr:hypothetical protein CYMTET_23941 [Cymbomonas tetramitiformis]
MGAPSRLPETQGCDCEQILNRLGCEVDCGYEINLVSRTVVIQAAVPKELAQYATTLLVSVAWNFCLKDEKRISAGMDALCWYKQEQKFDHGAQSAKVITTIDVPEGSTWYIRLRGDYYGLLHPCGVNFSKVVLLHLNLLHLNLLHLVLPLVLPLVLLP